MFEFNRDGILGEQASLPPSRIKIFGVGGVGIHCIDKMIIEGLNQMPLVSFDTRAQSLESSIAGEKVLLGKRILRGIGAGGDPESGKSAATDDEGVILSLMKDTDIVFLVGALGGGTATGGLPVFAKTARVAGIKTVSIVTLPYDFEGKRRMDDARRALDLLEEVSDCVLVLDHSRLSDLIDEIGGLRNSFESMTDLHVRAILALWRMLSFKNLAKIDFETIGKCFEQDAQTLFGYGEVRDRNVKDALGHVFSSVLMGNNILLRQADSVLMSITAGKEMTMQDVQHILDDVKLRLNPQTKIQVSASIHEDFDDRLNISVFAITPHGRPEIKPLSVVKDSAEIEMNLFQQPAKTVKEKSGSTSMASAFPNGLVESEITIKPAATVKPKKKRLEKQELIEFQKQKGRFDKTEPTMVNGVDLDIPTFMRKKIAIGAE